ncbi:unnamed protein product, partial [Urochloa humidicola]
SCGAIAQGCDGADAAGPGKSLGVACAGAEEFGRGYSTKILHRQRLLLQRQRRTTMEFSIVRYCNMGNNATPPGGFANFITPQFGALKPPQSMQQFQSEGQFSTPISARDNTCVNVDSGDEAPRTEKRILQIEQAKLAHLAAKEQKEAAEKSYICCQDPKQVVLSSSSSLPSSSSCCRVETL